MPPNCPKSVDQETSDAQVTPPTHCLERRRTKNWGNRETMLKAHKPVENLKPDLPAKTFDSWNQFQSTVADYKAKYFLHFRVRSSTKHNRFGAMLL
ncbi:hypothetical protein PI125_g22215 [Phytophthora idaei]|nr:hypothetical protein PI125_g22215 [Phytophthora idaei]